MRTGSKQSLWRPVWIAYGLSALLIAGLLVSGQIAIARLLDDISIERPILNEARSQIALSGDLVRDADELRRMRTATDIAGVTAGLRSTLGHWESAHATLRAGVERLHFTEPDRARVQQWFRQSQDPYALMRNSTRRILDEQRATPSSEEYAALAAQLAAAEPAYVSVMNGLYDVVETAYERQMVRLRTEGWLFALAVLAVIGALASLVIAPAFRRTAHELQQAVRTREQHARLDAELGRQIAEYQKREVEAQFRTLFRDSTAGVALLDDNGLILETNSALQHVVGKSARELAGVRFDDLIPHDAAADGLDGERTPNGRLERLEEVRFDRGDGAELWLQVQLSTVRSPADDHNLAIGTVVDVTERRRAADQLRFEASHDPLTGLLNRRIFAQSLDAACADAARTFGIGFAVLVIDLDRFKAINDSRGHAIGDHVLVETARRILSCTRPTDVVARVGGDEFALLASGARDEPGAAALIDRLEQAIAAPMTVDERRIATTASIGIAFWHPRANSGDELLRSADEAAYQAKARGRARHVFFSEEMETRSRSRARIAAELPLALDRAQFALAFQPIRDLASLRCVGFEALVRWHHPELGEVGPSDFIPLAEESGAIMRIGSWVLREAVGRIAQWRKSHPGLSLKMNVNVSAQQFVQADFHRELADVLREFDVPGSVINLELVETAMLDGTRLAADALSETKRLGVRLTLDDFGTGYSSLLYLQRLPIDSLKIDRSFVNGKSGQLASHTIVETLITLGNSLNIDVVAEGIETESQLTELRNLGCHLGQGYFLGKPVGLVEAATIIGALNGKVTGAKSHPAQIHS